jgi:hypothetical protein
MFAVTILIRLIYYNRKILCSPRSVLARVLWLANRDLNPKINFCGTLPKISLGRGIRTHISSPVRGGVLTVLTSYPDTHLRSHDRSTITDCDLIYLGAAILTPRRRPISDRQDSNLRLLLGFKIIN